MKTVTAGPLVNHFIKAVSLYDPSKDIISDNKLLKFYLKYAQ